MGQVVIEGHADEVLRYFDQQGEKAMKEVGMTAETYCKEICPVDTGALRNSITHGVLVGDGQVAAVLGTDMYYAPYVELGHHQQPGRYVPKLGKRLVASFVQGKPFIRPAIENHVEEYFDIIQHAFND